jgi:tetratricopeptide (TPR) repeat protein
VVEDRGHTDQARGDAPRQRSGPVAPTELGRFIVLRPIGAGGMGVVYAAYDPELDRKVAVKLLHPSVSGSAREALARVRLVREAQAMARLSHPNVVSVFDVGTYQGQVFIAMEFIAGVSLTAWLHARPRSYREVLAVFQEAGRGLAAAHREGLAHGDFKPDNVLVDSAGRVRVLDFGLAFAQDRDHDETTAAPRDIDLGGRLTRSDTLTGTPAYLSPEQFDGARGSTRADQFSFCVSLHEGFYGARPFLGDDLDAIILAIGRGVPPEPRDRRLPAWLRKVLLRGLSLDPAQRFADMDALLAALGRDPTRRRRRLLAVLGVLLALVLAALAYRWVLVRALNERQGLCAGATAELAGVWDPDRRDRVERAFLATELPYANDAWTRVAARLDGHTAAWVQMHTEACQATHLRGEQSPALLDLRMACLQRRRTETRSLVDVLVDADAGVVENAAQAVAELPELGPCADVATLLAVEAPRATPEQLAAAAAVRDQLAQAKALLVTARFKAGLELADAALERSGPLADLPLTAEVRLMQGELLNALGDPRAEATLSDAFFIAESTHDDPLTARLALELMHIAAARLDLTTAGQWSRHGRALIDRLGDAHPSERRALESERFSTLGTLGVHAGQLEQAEADYRRALELILGHPGHDELRVAGIHNNLGNLLVRRGALDRAALELDRAAAIYREVLGPRHPSLAIALSNAGEVEMSRGEWATARSTYAQAHTIFLAALGPDHPNVGVVENNLGDAAQRLGDLVGATAHYTRASAIFSARFGADAPPLVFPLTGLGETLLAQGQPRAAQERLERALALGDPGSPADLARARLALARALAPEAHARAAALATQARDAFAAGGPSRGRELAAAEAWLREHPGAPAPRGPDPR